jgi:uncharacterized repeat protein (TIGR01451 family)
VWDGTHFLVVFGGGGDIFGRRLDTGGALVDASPFAISNHADAQYQPFAVSDGSTTFVVWSDDRNASTSGTDVYGARVSGSTVMDAAGIAISTAAGEQSYPRVTHGGGNWFIVWTDFRSGTHQDIYGARVAQSTGTLLDGVTTGLAVSAPTSNQYGPWPASNGTDYFVVWTDDRNQFTTGIDVYGARVTSAGVILDATGIQICNDDSEQSSPSIAYNGGNYLVVWTDGRSTGLYGNRVNGVTGALVDGAAGVRIDASTIDLMVSLPRIHVAGADFYVVWSELQGENLAYVNILGSRLTSALSLQDAPGVSLASSANSQTEVAVASNGADYFVVWVDDRGLGKAIYGARVNGTTGASLDPAAILLSNGGLGEASPALAFNGTHYLVVWRDSRFPAGIWGTRVDPATGAVIDPSGLNLFPTPANQPYSPQLASDGASWFVVWQDTRNAGSSDIYGGLVTGAGTPLNPAGILISNAASSQFRPRVAFGDGYYLVVWADMRAGGNMDLYGARVSASGTVVEPTATNLPIATGPGFVTAGGYDVAHASPRFVVAYEEAGIVRRARVASATGAVVDDLALTACCAHFPSIAYDQDTFVVAYNIPPAGGLGYDLKGTRVTAAGVDIDATDWDIVTGGGLMLPDHRVAALGPLGKALVAYSRYDSTPGITSQRARTRLLTRIPRADLAVTKTDGVTTAVRGLGLTYSMVVSNVGPDDVTGATVADVIPSSLVCSTTCAGTGAATCAAGPFAGSINDAVDIPSGQSVTYTSVCTVSPSASGSISNTVTVAVPAGTEDANPANNSATDTDVVAQMADLSVTKTDGVTTLMPGQLVNYTITVSNLGPDAVTGAHVVDAAPFELQGVSWTCSGSPGSSCTAVGSVSISDLADIPAGGAVTYTLTATVDWALGGGPLANSASVTPPAGAFDPNPANDSATDTDTIVAPSLSVGDVTVAEGNAGATIAHFTVTLSPASPVQVSVSYTTQGVTALAGSDFVAAAGTLTFDAGETSKPIDVTVNGDTQFEPNETFAVNLSGASAAVIGDGTGVGTIANDDTPAGPSRVFVSVLGLDTNDCSNIATPCRTLNAAMAQVAVDGEVIVIKSGSYAGGAITKGVKIDVASGVVAFSGQPISIDAGSGRVVLRGLTLKAVTPGLGTGILVQSAAAVFVENSVVDGWDIGIHQAGVPQGGGSEVFVTDTTIRNNNTGLYAAAGGTAILDTRVSNNGIGLAADYATLSVRGATLSGNVTGIDAHNKSSVTVEKSQIAHNGIGITLPASSLSTVRLSRSVVSGNTIGLENVDGTLEVSGNNVIRGNTTNTSGMITPGGLQ